MSTADDEADEVLAAYRRASVADAGRPSAKTRDAILAEARAVAGRRAPAANDSRFSWRMAAGLAVVGLALLVWRQLPREAVVPAAQEPVVTAELMKESELPPAVKLDMPRPEIASAIGLVARCGCGPCGRGPCREGRSTASGARTRAARNRDEDLRAGERDRQAAAAPRRSSSISKCGSPCPNRRTCPRSRRPSRRRAAL